jgi:excisionase family DNA binding protein
MASKLLEEKEVVSMSMQKKEVMLQPLLLSIPETAAVLRLSRAKVYQLIDCEGLPVVRFGRAVRVSVNALERWLQERGKVA